MARTNTRTQRRSTANNRGGVSRVGGVDRAVFYLAIAVTIDGRQPRDLPTSCRKYSLATRFHINSTSQSLLRNYPLVSCRRFSHVLSATSFECCLRKQAFSRSLLKNVCHVHDRWRPMWCKDNLVLPIGLCKKVNKFQKSPKT